MEWKVLIIEDEENKRATAPGSAVNAGEVACCKQWCSCDM